jgi:DNA ligase-associated metallophosphoesterase
MKTLPIEIQGQSLLLSSGRAVFWENERTLILTDLHIGKSGHFRKAGIPVPGQVQEADLERLTALISQFSPRRLLVTGDMFHAQSNLDVERFQSWRQEFPMVDMVLVKGNHDILKTGQYHSLGLQVVPDGHTAGPFRFVHHPPPTQEALGAFTFCGHLHPGIGLQGPGRQRLKFPCFWFSRDRAVLPAFSMFTGLALIQPAREDRVFALVEGEVLAL